MKTIGATAFNSIVGSFTWHNHEFDWHNREFRKEWGYLQNPKNVDEDVILI